MHSEHCCGGVPCSDKQYHHHTLAVQCIQKLYLNTLHIKKGGTHKVAVASTLLVAIVRGICCVDGRKHEKRFVGKDTTGQKVGTFFQAFHFINGLDWG